MVRQSKKGTGDCLTLKMEALLSFETLATIYQLPQHDIPENLNTFGFFLLVLYRQVSFYAISVCVILL
jgi:hypothetical protein